MTHRQEPLDILHLNTRWTLAYTCLSCYTSSMIHGIQGTWPHHLKVEEKINLKMPSPTPTWILYVLSVSLCHVKGFKWSTRLFWEWRLNQNINKRWTFQVLWSIPGHESQWEGKLLVWVCETWHEYCTQVGWYILQSLTMSLTPISKIGVGLTASLRAGLQKPWRIIPATQIIWFLIWASHNSLQVHCQQWPLTCFAENTKACLPLVPSEKYNAHTHGEELPSAYTCGRCNAHTKNTWKYTLIIGLQHTYVDIYFVTVQILRTNKSWHFLY